MQESTPPEHSYTFSNCVKKERKNILLPTAMAYLKGADTKERNDFVSTLPVIQDIHVPRLVIKAELSSMDLPTPQQQHMVLYYMLNRSQKRMYYKTLVQQIPCYTASKAVHLHIVSDLTTDVFLATLKHFVARRGKYATISSDNTKNFVGANRELKRLHNVLKFPEENLSSYLSSEGISWNFMSPRAPNFGGLWEAGVKSFKFYLKRAVGNRKMTLEEFLTILTQIEGILSSRPITPLSEDIDDLEVHTPGQFLIGRPITSISESNLLDKTENTPSRWQKLTKIVQHIWTK
ncbi:integrase catalytic domain-containing protein [Trichonephila clavipes]|nr:integrase catalytic domain-containing protein [Trichonephila clavipes]